MIDILKKYWIKIHFKNNWKFTDIKLKHKLYSMSVNEHAVINEILDKLHDQEKTYWIQNSALYVCPVFMTWWTMYKNEKSIWKNWAIVDLQELNWATMSDIYFLSLQTDIIMLILDCKYISMMNETDFFDQWQVVVKNCE